MIQTATPYDTLTVNELSPEEAVAQLIEHAAQMRASDLFFASNEHEVDVSVRHLGMTRPLAVLSPSMGRHCITHIKVLTGMDLTEHRRPLDGRWIHDLSDGSRIDLRINTLPTMHGEDCALRLLSRDLSLLELDELGLIPSELEQLRTMLSSPSGLILVTGPTGSGKTSTLYACLRHLNTGERKINTIEDPIEYEIEGTRQSQINPRIGVGFPDLLPSVLRQAPDVIMIGEIRDADTAATAVRAANSGHLVLATLHAPIAAAALTSMRAWGVHPHFVASSLLGVFAQRLVRTLCRECQVPVPPGELPPPLNEIRRLLGPNEEPRLYKARGCPACHETGYASRMGVFEVLHMSPAIRRLIAAGRPTQTIRNQAVREAQIELRQAALLKVAQGLTTMEEVLRVIPTQYLGREG